MINSQKSPFNSPYKTSSPFNSGGMIQGSFNKMVGGNQLGDKAAFDRSFSGKLKEMEESSKRMGDIAMNRERMMSLENRKMQIMSQGSPSLDEMRELNQINSQLSRLKMA